MPTRSKRSVALSSTIIGSSADGLKVKLAPVPTPAIGSNSGKVKILDARVIHQWVTQAIQENDESGKLKGTAVQRFGAAIIAQVQTWNELGHPDENVDRVPSLASCLKSKEAKGEMLPLLRTALLAFGDMPDDVNAIATEKAKRTAQNNLLGRALKLAAIIVGNNMSLASFNVTAGCFTVPPAMILPAAHYWTGYMASPDKPATVLVDGRAYSCEKKVEGKTLPQRVAASVEMLFRVAVPQRKKPEPKKGEVVWDEKAMAPVAKAAPTGWLVRALHARFTELTEGSEDGDMTGALTSEEWAMSSDIAQWSDAAQSRKGFVKDAIDKERAGKSMKA